MSDDLFISYAHIDNESIQDYEGWVETFHEVLEVRLRQLTGTKPSIWRDPKLSGNDVFDEELEERFTNAYLLVSVLSPGYLESQWCQRELEAFVAAAKNSGGLALENKSRAFKVLKTPVGLARHPEPLKKSLGYRFFDIDPDTGRPREFNPIFGKDAERQFLQKLEDLAQDVAALLDVRGDSSPKDATKPAVYLAPTGYDLAAEYDALRRELVEHGYSVRPAGDLPTTAAEFEATVRAALGDSRLAIHLVGSKAGFRPDGSDVASVEWQHALAQAQGREPARIVWIAPPTVEEPDEEQLAFIRELRERSEPNQGAEVLEGTVESLKTVVHQKLDAIEAASRAGDTAAAATTSGPRRVYLLHEASDAEAVIPIDDTLFESGFEVLKPLTDGTTKEVLDDHKANLKTCDAVLVFYGNSRQSWVRQKWNEILKAPGYGRAPIDVKAVYVAPPEEPHKTRYRTHEALVIKAFGDFAPESLSEFVAAVEAIL